MDSSNDPVVCSLTSGKRIPALDGVRGLAIILVLLWHFVALQIPETPGTWQNLIRLLLGTCWSGVDLFFVLSGFLIGGILVDHRGKPGLLKVFYARRAVRIFPIYYAWLILYQIALLCGLNRLAPQAFDEQTPFWGYLIYVQNILQSSPGVEGSRFLGVTWSLALEEQFYLLFPWFVVAVAPKRYPWALMLVAFSATFFRLLVFYFLPKAGVAGYFLLPCRWDALLLGAFGAWLIRQPTVVGHLRANLWFLWSLIGMSACILVVLRVVKQGNPIYAGMHHIGFLVLAMTFLSLIYLALLSRSPLIRGVFDAKALQFLGTISYGVYLFHQPIAWVLHSLIWHADPTVVKVGPMLTTIASFFLSIALAWFSWRCFESPILKWGRRFQYPPHAGSGVT